MGEKNKGKYPKIGIREQLFHLNEDLAGHNYYKIYKTKELCVI